MPFYHHLKQFKLNFIEKRVSKWIHFFQELSNDVKIGLDGEEDWFYADGEGSLHSENLFRLYRGQSQFALSMLKSLNNEKPQNNHIFSPHSTYRALVLAYFGAEGKTKETLEKSMYMNWAKSRSDVADAYKAELIARSERFLGRKLQFNSVDRLFVSQEAILK